MKYHQKIAPLGGAPIAMTYRRQELQSGDTPLAVYSSYRISILLSDGMSAVMGDRIIAAKAGSVLFFRPEELHFGRVYRSGTHEYLDIFLPLSLSNWAPFGDAMDFLMDTSEERINCIAFEGEAQRQVEMLAREMAEVLHGGKSKSEMRLFSLLLQIILLCSDSYEEAKLHPPVLELPPLVKSTLQEISEHFTKPLSLEALAAKANCSVAYLSRVFKAYTGMTVYYYITSLRIAYARRLLSSGVSVTEACFASGFNDCSNFIRTFRRMTGKTPKQFRNTKNE